MQNIISCLASYFKTLPHILWKLDDRETKLRFSTRIEIFLVTVSMITPYCPV